MTKTLFAIKAVVLAGAALLSTHGPAFAQPGDAKTAAHYSVSTTLVGKLLDDPAAVAILKDIVPTVYGNAQFQTAGRDLTLKDIQTYEPDALSDANLTRIQSAFDKIPVKD